jgi:hypothetical protein
MPKYRLILTRDTTESVFVDIEADDETDAHNQALENVPDEGWGLDDGNLATAPYVTGCELIQTRKFNVQVMYPTYFDVEVLAEDEITARELAVLAVQENPEAHHTNEGHYEDCGCEEITE